MKIKPSNGIYDKYNPTSHFSYTMGRMAIFILLVFLILIAICIVANPMYFWFIAFAIWYTAPCLISTILTTLIITMYIHYSLNKNNKPKGGVLLFLFSFVMFFILGYCSLYYYTGASVTEFFNYTEFIKSALPLAMCSVIFAFTQVAYIAHLLHHDDEPSPTNPKKPHENPKHSNP